MADSASSRHALATRVIHAGVALAVITQLLLSLVMEGPRPDRPDGTALTVHEYVGIGAMVVILAFWINLTLRLRGTPAGALFPWFSPARLAALGADIAETLRALVRFRMPHFAEASPWRPPCTDSGCCW